MSDWWLYVLAFLLILLVIGVVNQQMQRRHERELAEITGEHPTEWSDNE